jgi:hypothetical protein
MQFDPLDVALNIGVLISGFIMVGIAEFSLFNVDFGATALTLSGYDLSTAYVLSLGAFVGVIFTNDNTSLGDLKEDVENLRAGKDEYSKYSEYATYYGGSIIVTVALFAGWVFFPDTVASWFQSGDLQGLIYVGITSTATFAAGWIL